MNVGSVGAQLKNAFLLSGRNKYIYECKMKKYSPII